MAKPTLSFSRNRDFGLGLLLLAATSLAYLPALNGKPLWDDNMHMTPPELRSMDGLVSIWTHTRETMQYFPLAHSVFWLEGNLWGDSTLPYHLLSLMLHVLSALILVRVLRKLQVPGPWLAAAIFALHPVMVESVAWISELKNTLSGVFFLAAALTYLTYAENGSRRSYVSSLGLFVLGLLSKSTIATFPIAMLAVLWFKRGRLSWKRDIVPLLPFFLGGILFGLIALQVERTHIGTRAPEFGLSAIERCLLAGRAIGFYLGKVVLPLNLTFSYPRWGLSAALWWQYLFPAAVLVAGGILWVRRKVWRAPAAVFFYFTAMLLPYLGFRSFYTFRYSFVADHYQYLAAIGPIVLGAGWVEMTLGSIGGARTQLKTAVSVMLLLALGTLSWKQSRMYSDPETLYRTTLTRNEDCWMAHNDLGILLAKSGRSDEAFAHYQRALDLNPNFAEAHNNVGLMLADMGRLNEALAHYQSAVRLDPSHAKPHNNVGTVLAKLGRTDEALAHYEKALELKPNHPEVDFNLGVLLSDMGRTNEALAHYERALDLNPNHVDAHNNFGTVLAKLGRTDEALAHYEKALEIDHNRGDVQFNLADLLSDMGRSDEALAHYRKALELNPNHPEFHYNLGLLLTQMGQTAEAIVHYQKALDFNPNHAGAHGNLGILLAGIGQLDEALAHFRRALDIDPYAIRPLKNLAVVLAQKGQLADANAVLERALASAKSAGDAAREREIVDFLAKFHQITNPSKANSRTAAHR
jgi:protein O-mannosyl-transferase